jgi:thiol-disulfide isomerase/thioredoxin
MRRVVLVIVAAALLAACGGSGNSATGKTLDASFTKFDGSMSSFQDFRGTPVVVNFFSSSCIPCQAEMPDFERVHRTLGASVTFVGLDVQDTVDEGQAFAVSVGVTWVLGRDPTAQILQGRLKSTNLPTTAILDKDGHVVFLHAGKLDNGELEQQLRDNHLIS